MNQPNDKGKSAAPAQAKPAAPTAAAAAVESPCPECGEKVRKGLVRCWNCGAFMNASIQARYQELQTNPAPPIFSQVPDSEVSSVDPSPEDDFQLGAEDSTTLRQPDLRGLESVEAGRAPAAAVAAPGDAGPATAHSVATAGDVLFAAAMQEQAENRERRKKRATMVGGAKTPGGFIIFCPYGCRIEVKEQHRGSQGRCPRCRAPFVVPIDPPDFSALRQAAAAAAASAGGEESAAKPERQWLDDLHVHIVPPEKLKLKADSLLKDFTEQDFAFTSEGIVRVNLTKKASGLFGGAADKKKGETRTAVRLHLQENKTAATIPAGEVQSYAADQIRELRVVQPVASRAQSLFHGVPVFGAGRIAVQLPLGDDGTPMYVSLGIMQFRKFARMLQEFHGIENFGADCGIPLSDEYNVVGKCHYLGTPVKSLKHLEYYQADPTVSVVLSGWKCDKCSVVMSEEGRAKDKFGGKDGKGIAKTKCPKCAQKFGSNPQYTLKDAGSAPPPADDSKAEQPAAT
jgi:hypothetical protein